MDTSMQKKFSGEMDRKKASARSETRAWGVVLREGEGCHGKELGRINFLKLDIIYFSPIFPLMLKLCLHGAVRALLHTGEHIGL